MTPPPPPDDKRRVRRDVRARMTACDDAARAASGQEIAAHLGALLDTLPAGAPVALFAALPAELVTDPLLDAARSRGLPVALPRVAGDELVFHRLPPAAGPDDLPRSAFGVPEPRAGWPEVPLHECALVVVPGVAFDLHGGRLGYGRGFYDRALGRMRIAAPVPAVGACMDCQLVPRVPMGPHDEPLSGLVTPGRGLVWC